MSDTAIADPVTATMLARTDDLPPDEVEEVADNFVELMRSFGRARARIIAAAEHDVEWSAHVLLKIVQTEGPLRAGALAESMQADPSTVSRQVAALVKDGMLERRADPQDGRASLLVVTARGEDVLADHNRIRLEYFAHMLSGWDKQELRDFAGQLRRFTADYESAHNEHWIKKRIARSTAQAPSNAGSTTR